MPTYPYQCVHCQHEFDLFQKITDEPTATCPECGANGAKRGIGGGMSRFQFKGSGFYITDYRNPQSPPPEANPPGPPGSCGGCCPCKPS